MLRNDWRSTRLGSVATLRRGFDLPRRCRKPGDVPIVTSSGVDDWHSEFAVRGPGVVTGRYGTIGQVFFIETDFWPLNTALYVCDFHGNDPLYVSYLLRTIDFHTHSGKSGVPGVNRNDLHEIDVFIPPTRTEQESIAGALSDADALIKSAERLVAKKRQIKLGALQELLTGRKRLLGPASNGQFKLTEVGLIPVDWDVTTVGAEFSIQLGKMLDAEKNVGVAKPFIGNRAVQWGRIDVSDIGTVKMSPSDLRRYRLSTGDLLVCEGGEVGRAAIWEAPLEECYFQKALHRLRSKGRLDLRLLLNILHLHAKSGMLLSFVTQTSIAHLPKDKFETVPIPFPPTSGERLAIADVLADMDAEIESLEAKLAKARLVKQGMMQELLTGRIRLV